MVKCRKLADISEGDINHFIKNKKLEQVVAICKSCNPNALGDLTLTLKDLSGTISGTIHHKVLTEGGYGKAITIRAALILQYVSDTIPGNDSSLGGSGTVGGTTDLPAIDGHVIEEQEVGGHFEL
ncbi:hypothetical protein CTI12_AA043220 [Artemisia annua]|uniref:Homologous recombination OB-fold protein OB-fold domain-containing protein n=1 Tax=Artemisia annua TaxID=35608 RepID=A0A2U1QDI5_ARTAN|nr:hypothetical protein CTI12_AA043220 [Artemisia annua]